MELILSMLFFMGGFVVGMLISKELIRREQHYEKAMRERHPHHFGRL